MVSPEPSRVGRMMHEPDGAGVRSCRIRATLASALRSRTLLAMRPILFAFVVGSVAGSVALGGCAELQRPTQPAYSARYEVDANSMVPIVIDATRAQHMRVAVIEQPYADRANFVVLPNDDSADHTALVVHLASGRRERAVRDVRRSVPVVDRGDAGRVRSQRPRSARRRRVGCGQAARARPARGAERTRPDTTRSAVVATRPTVRSKPPKQTIQAIRAAWVAALVVGVTSSLACATSAAIDRVDVTGRGRRRAAVEAERATAGIAGLTALASPWSPRCGRCAAPRRAELRLGELHRRRRTRREHGCRGAAG